MFTNYLPSLLFQSRGLKQNTSSTTLSNHILSTVNTQWRLQNRRPIASHWLHVEIGHFRIGRHCSHRMDPRDLISSNKFSRSPDLLQIHRRHTSDWVASAGIVMSTLCSCLSRWKKKGQRSTAKQGEATMADITISDIRSVLERWEIAEGTFREVSREQQNSKTVVETLAEGLEWYWSSRE